MISSDKTAPSHRARDMGLLAWSLWVGAKKCFWVINHISLALVTIAFSAKVVKFRTDLTGLLSLESSFRTFQG